MSCGQHDRWRKRHVLQDDVIVSVGAAHYAPRTVDLVWGPLLILRCLQASNPTERHDQHHVAIPPRTEHATLTGTAGTETLRACVGKGAHLGFDLTGCDRVPQRRSSTPLPPRRRDAATRPARTRGGVRRDIASWWAASGREAAADLAGTATGVGSTVTSAASELSEPPSPPAGSAAGMRGASAGAASRECRSTRNGTASGTPASHAARLRLDGNCPRGGSEAAGQAAPDQPGTYEQEHCTTSARRIQHSGLCQGTAPQRSARQPMAQHVRV